ncbi:MAG: DUF5683 domain-containing protein [Weeksellaceae bacterium]
MRSFIFIFLFVPLLVFAQFEPKRQNDSISINSSDVDIITKLDTKNPIKASIYSAVLPGLGQAYNEKYWKVPIVWGAIGTGIGFTIYYEDLRNKYRDAFLAQLKGEEHEYTGILEDATRLGNLQDDMRRNRDYAIAITVLAYMLNIIDATVDAHLYDIRKDRDLSIDPMAFANPVTGETNLGLSLKLNIK